MLSFFKTPSFPSHTGALQAGGNSYHRLRPSYRPPWPQLEGSRVRSQHDPNPGGREATRAAGPALPWLTPPPARTPMGAPRLMGVARTGSWGAATFQFPVTLAAHSSR